ncbi:NAD(P)-binding protein [Rhizopogon salebrosus TDB-379]|nr:NAD(P)-binding protein [Rhizopogon salebrosus TDB-379]
MSDGNLNGVGFGICQRLLPQVTSRSPTDAQPHYDFHVKQNIDDEVSFSGLTLILACRSRQRGEAARDTLHRLVDERVRQLETLPGYDGHAGNFRRHLTIAVHTVDLVHIQSVFRFADEVTKTHPYISHLICNAGVAYFVSIHWFLAIEELATDWVKAVAAPIYYMQEVGQPSQDGLGWVWHSSVFGHCVLLTKTAHSYESSKFQMDLIAHQLDQASLREESDKLPVRHPTVLPGVAGTNIAGAVLCTLSSIGMFLAFYIARFLGSPYHLISAFKAAISAVHLCLVLLAFLPTVSSPELDGLDPTTPAEVGVRYVSQCDRWGKERVGTMGLTLSKEQEKQSDELLKHCERLFTAFCEAEGRLLPS